MRLRRATPEDRELLELWDEAPHVKAAVGEDDGSLDWAVELARDVPWRELLIAEEAGRAIGMLQIIDPAEEETHYWGDVEANLRAIDIWIGEAADLGRGFGTRMMQLAIARCFARPEVTAILIDPLESNVRAIRFYGRLGFAPVGPRVFETETCLVMRLGRGGWERRGGKPPSP